MKTLVAAAVLSVLSLSPQAATLHTFDFTFNGSTSTTNASAAGAQLLNGDTVRLNLRAAGNDYFVASGAGTWVPLGMVECGNRMGDLSFTAWLDGSVVSTGGYSNQNSACVHIANFMNIAFGTQFDRVEWNFTQSSFDTGTNTMTDLFMPNNPTLGYASYVQNQNRVPAPSSLLLAGIAALGLGALLRRQRI